jgi:hypothetical protein
VGISSTTTSDGMWKFPAPPEPQKVKSETGKSLESLQNTAHKVVTTKERKDKAQMPVDHVPDQEESTDEWLTPEQAVGLGLTPGSRLYKQATGELLTQ